MGLKGLGGSNIGVCWRKEKKDRSQVNFPERINSLYYSFKVNETSFPLLLIFECIISTTHDMIESILLPKKAHYASVLYVRIHFIHRP